MAEETTATTVTELINSEWIYDVLQAPAKQNVVIWPRFLQVNLKGKATATVAIPREVSDTSSNFTGYDGPGEATDMSNEDWETTESTPLAVAEFGVARDVTDIALEDNIMGEGLIDYLIMSAALDLELALDDDAAALLDGFSTSKGTTTVPLNLNVLMQAIGALRKADHRAPGAIVAIVGGQQASHLDQSLLAATSTTVNSYARRNEEGGWANGFLMNFHRAEVFMSTLVDTANGGADEVGGVFISGDGNPRSAACVCAQSRPIRPELFRDVRGRATLLVVTRRAAVGEISDTAGVEFIGKATE